VCVDQPVMQFVCVPLYTYFHKPHFRSKHTINIWCNIINCNEIAADILEKMLRIHLARILQITHSTQNDTQHTQIQKQ
jgi:hypothetical protein